MKTEKVIPVSWERWDQLDVLAILLYEAKFTEDFGVFKEGEKFSSITVDYSRGYIEAYSEDGSEVVKRQDIIARPKE